jgi:phytoene dehydrogenase-like protein
MSRRAIVVGGGHNGLVAAFYLAQAGLEVEVLERREFVGGAVITEELFPGYFASSCSYLLYMLQDKIIEEMDLRGHGLKIQPLDPIRFSPLPEQQYFLTWHDVDKTAQEIGRLHAGDGARFPDFNRFMDTAAGILHRYFLEEPPGRERMAAELRGPEEERAFKALYESSMWDVVHEYFEHPGVRTAFLDVQDAGFLKARGSVMSLAHMKCCASQKNFGIPVGGMGSVTQAMAAAARALGVRIRTRAPVERILLRDGQARGVLLEGGERLEADLVLSNADPKRTFGRLLASEDLPSGYQQKVESLRTQAAYLKFHAAVDEIPDFSAHLGQDYDPTWLTYTRICPSWDYHMQSWKDASEGRPSSCPVMLVQVPSIHDPSLTPEGKHIVSVWVMYAPVVPARGSWDELREEVAESLIDRLTEWAPNFKRSVLQWELFTPADLEERVGLTNGNIRHLDLVPDQMLAGRPGYRTPIENLYLCGAGTHPGGEVNGAPGHNSARVVLADLA